MTSRYPGGLVRRTAANTAITGASGVWDLGSQAQAVRNNTWPISGLALPVSGSLRFRASVSAYLYRTPASASNRRTWTWSAWVKLGEISASNNTLFNAGSTTSGETTKFNFRYTGSQFQASYGSQNLDTTVAVYRDPSAWYHIVLAVDTTQATASNRIKIYVNGVLQAVTTSVDYTQNVDTPVNNTEEHNIGRGKSSGGAEGHCDGYMAEVNFIDGQQLTPSSFGQTSAITGVWEPIKYTGTYGTNGFYLSLSDTSSIGKDFSGNGNNWTPNNISTTSDSTFDLMRDVPTQYTPQSVTDVGGTVRGNYCVLNPLFNPNGSIVTYSNGNLNFSHSSGTANQMPVQGTIALPAGKFYWEYTVGATVNDQVGIATAVVVGGSADGTAGARYRIDGTFQSSYTTPSSAASYTTGDVIGVAYDQPNGTLAFYKNNSLQGTVTTISTSEVFFPSRSPNSSGSGGAGSFNFGQQSFTYTPPSGFKSLCTTNLPTPTIGATTATATNKYFDATLYTGTGATLSVTNAGGFQPDFVWLKSRSAITNHQLFDAVRGATKVIVSNTTESESTSANTITSFNSGGFTVGTNTAINTSAATHVGWQWWAGGSTVTNTSGSISSQVRASTTTGFSVVTYTGNGSAGATIGHGLGAAPSMLMFKNRDETGGNSILVWHSSFTNQEQMLLSSTAAIYNPGNGLYFNSTTPGASVVTLGTSGATNASSQNMLMYAWTPIAGFSAFGSYTGNGSTDGAFIFTGFRPRYVMVKCSSNITNWWVYDSSRNTYNEVDLGLLPSQHNADTSGYPLDFLSNGFKFRNSNGDFNGSGRTYIYMAFAETPFKNSLAR